MIGAPAASSGAGAAYLVYGGSSLAGLATTTNGVRYINLSLVGTTGTGAVPGAIFTGPAGGAMTGYSVSTAGDFNDSGFADIMIGSPGYSGSSHYHQPGRGQPVLRGRERLDRVSHGDDPARHHPHRHPVGHLDRRQRRRHGRLCAVGGR